MLKAAQFSLPFDRRSFFDPAIQKISDYIHAALSNNFVAASLGQSGFTTGITPTLLTFSHKNQRWTLLGVDMV